MSRRSSWFKFIGLIILAWLLWNTDLGQIGTAVSKANLWYIFLAVVFVTTNVIFKFARYQYILYAQGVTHSFIKTIHFSLAALYLSFVTPGRVGEVSKAYFIHKNTGAPLGKLLAGSAVDRGFDVYTLLATALLGLFILAPGSNIHPGQVAIAIGIAAVIPLVVLLPPVREALARLVGLLQKLFTGKETGAQHVREFFIEINALFGWRLLGGFVVSIIAYAAFFASCYAMTLSLGLSLDYLKVSVFTAFANILSFLPISFAGIGTREATLVYLFKLEGISAENALAFSALIFSMTYLLFGLIGFFSFSTLDYKKEDLMKDA